MKLWQLLIFFGKKHYKRGPHYVNTTLYLFWKKSIKNWPPLTFCYQISSHKSLVRILAHFFLVKSLYSCVFLCFTHMIRLLVFILLTISWKYLKVIWIVAFFSVVLLLKKKKITPWRGCVTVTLCTFPDYSNARITPEN